MKIFPPGLARSLSLPWNQPFLLEVSLVENGIQTRFGYGGCLWLLGCHGCYILSVGENLEIRCAYALMFVFIGMSLYIGNLKFTVSPSPSSTTSSSRVPLSVSVFPSGCHKSTLSDKMESIQLPSVVLESLGYGWCVGRGYQSTDQV